MEAVGYDLYCKMLNEAVSRLKNDEPETEEYETSIDIQVDAFIPASYIPSEFQKLDMYKRIAGIEGQDEYQDMQDELLDRFGDIPLAVDNLLKIACIKAKAHRAGISQIEQKPGGIKICLHSTENILPERVAEMVKEFRGKMRYIPDDEPYFFYQLERQEAQKIRQNIYAAKRTAEKKKPLKVTMAEEVFQILESSVEKIGGLYEEK